MTIPKNNLPGKGAVTLGRWFINGKPKGRLVSQRITDQLLQPSYICTAARLAQLGQHRSAEREVVGSILKIG